MATRASLWCKQSNTDSGCSSLEMRQWGVYNFTLSFTVHRRGERVCGNICSCAGNVKHLVVNTCLSAVSMQVKKELSDGISNGHEP